MTRQPQSLDEAKQIFQQEKAKVASALSAVAGSRWLLAILATFALAFGSHLAYAPSRLPAVGGLSLSQTGLPPSLDWGVAGEQVTAAREAAQRENVPAKVKARLAEEAEANARLIPALNAIGFGLCLLLLAINLWIMTKRRPVSRG